MKIINAKIHVVLCASAIEEGLNTLKVKNIGNVFLLTSPKYVEFIFRLVLIHKFQLDDLSEKVSLPISNIDTSKTLKKDSWMLIDYTSNQIYYSKGA